MAERFDTVIIGAGQAGLAASYYLTQQGRDHIILEKHRIGESWRSKRWDSFTLVTPTWTVNLPGFAYGGDKPDGFLRRDDVVKFLEDYAASFGAPVRTGVTVDAVREGELGFIVETNNGPIAAENVIVAVGLFQKPKLPPCSQRVAPHIRQLHTSEYRNSGDLPPGAVLVVGSGQSGCQISEELNQQGREVYLCTGRSPRLPRRYRGHDIFHWLHHGNVLSRGLDTLESPAERFAPHPQLAGKEDGTGVNLHQLASDGVRLLGRLQDVDGVYASIGGDLMDNIAMTDKTEAEIKDKIDEFIVENGLQAPADDAPALSAGYDAEIIRELDLHEAGITSIIWACGYSFDLSWVRFPIFDEFGYPVQQRGITSQPGLYFVGLHWLHTAASGLFYGVGEDAAHVTAHLANRTRRVKPLRSESGFGIS